MKDKPLRRISGGYDAIVLGLGGMGSAALFELARRGKRVLGLDAHAPPHGEGSSHGVSRIIRQAYFEDPAYVPLLLRSYELWERLERERGRRLLFPTGGLMVGPPDEVLVRESANSALQYGLPHHRFDVGEIRRRFPALTPTDDLAALYEERAGYLLVEACVQTFLEGAAALGAELRVREPALGWEVDAGGAVRVRTAEGTYEAARLIISAGPWARGLLGFELPLQVSRQTVFWFEPEGGTAPFDPSVFPVFAWQLDERSLVYGFPALEGPSGGVKVAVHAPGEPCDPESIRRRVEPEEVDAMRELLRARIPALAAGRLLRTATCLYTNTPDGHFVIDRHPAHEQVIAAAGFSGHGFKFASVVGEILAELAVEGATRHPIGLFSRARFAG